MSDRALRVTMLVLTTIGLGVASYLTYVHYSGAVPLCGKNGGSCLTVQTSTWSKLAGIPVPVLGLVGYVSILISLLVPQSENTRLATMGFTVIGFLFSAYLTYRELFSIHAICEWCVSSAVILTILMCLAIWRFLRGAPELAGSAPATPDSDGSLDVAAEPPVGGVSAGRVTLPININ
jgi:uncharacterized membrane protein